MAIHEVVITDVTCYGNLFCVAGWDRHANRMVRPEPPGTTASAEASRFWDGNYAGPGRLFAVGNIVRFNGVNPPADFPFPHATEDRIVDQPKSIEIVGHLTLLETAQAVAGSVSPSLETAFDGGLVKEASSKAHVAAGHFGRSLGAIEIVPTQLQFYVDTYEDKQKLRSHIKIGNGLYDLTVPSDAARIRWKSAGIEALQSDAKACGRIHVRVGLSRPFAGHPCYAQVNGLYFL